MKDKAGYTIPRSWDVKVLGMPNENGMIEYRNISTGKVEEAHTVCQREFNTKVPGWFLAGAWARILMVLHREGKALEYELVTS